MDGKRDGMDRAERHADLHWWQCMLEAGKAVAERMPYFNADDLLAWMRIHHPNASTHELRATGPLMLTIWRMGFCTPTDDFVSSRQPLCHATPRRVWYSLIYKGRSGPPRPRRRKLNDPRQLSIEW
jgi:hypothetical protein